MNQQSKYWRRYWWAITLYAVATVVLEGFIFTNFPPDYLSKISFFVTSLQSSALANVYDAPYADRAVKTVALLAANDETVNALAAKTGLNSNDIKESIKVKNAIGTQIIEVRVLNRNIGATTAVSQNFPAAISEVLQKIQKDTEEKNRIQISVAEQPTAPVTSSSSKLKVIAGILAVAAGFPYLVIRWLSGKDQPIESPDDLETHKMRTLGSYRFLKDPKATIEGILDPRHEHVAEALREIRTNVIFGKNSSQVKSIGVTSVYPKEGKSSLVAGLGLILAEINRRVVIIDADFKAPAIHRIFGLRASTGLGEYLNDTMTPKEKFIYKTKFPNLWVIPAGQRNNSQKLNGGDFKKLISRLTKSMTVDYVLVDTPPITASIDAAVISKNVDAIIVATEQGKTTSRELRKLVNALQKVNTRILGFVLTKYRAKKKIGYYQTDYHQL